MKSFIAFLNRNPWIYVAFPFAILIGAWTTIINIAVKNSPQVIEVRKTTEETPPNDH